jgi:hypothetical protein
MSPRHYPGEATRGIPGTRTGESRKLIFAGFKRDVKKKRKKPEKSRRL